MTGPAGPHTGLAGWSSPTAADVADLLAGHLPEVTALVPLGEGTCSVWKATVADGSTLLVKVAARDVTPAYAVAERAGRLARAGVRVPAPATPASLSARDWTVGLWQFLDAAPPAGPLQWQQVGQAVRTLHDVGARTLRNDDYLWHRDQPSGLGPAVRRLTSTGALTSHQADVLLAWANRLCRTTEGLRRHLRARAGRAEGATGADRTAADRVLVHDDLWPKNLLADRTGAWVLDLDDLGWGVRDYDLAFISRGHAEGVLTDEEAAAFVTGYGAPLPDIETAWVWGLVHRLRWLLRLAARAGHVTDGQATFEAEYALWERPGGPAGECFRDSRAA